MAMDLDAPLFLQQNGWLTAKKNRDLDIGPQNIYHVREQQIATAADQELAAIKASRSWRYTQPLRDAGHVARRALKRLRASA